MFGKKPSDPFLEEMDPMEKLWLYECWANDLESQYKTYRALGILIGSFWNPQAAAKMSEQGKPTYESDDESYEQTVKMVQEASNKLDVDSTNASVESKKRRKKRRIVKE